MDGEALSTLIGLTPGPDCLKDLIKKVGWRLKVYKAIKELYEGENVSLNNKVCMSSLNDSILFNTDRTFIVFQKVLSPA